MPKVELSISEDRLDEFEAWLAEHHPPPTTAEVQSFTAAPGGLRVVYRVVVTVRAPTVAEAIKAAWS